MAPTAIVLESASALWATERGRTLLAKTVLVVLVAGGGAYNHQVLIPQLGAAPDEPALVARFGAVVAFEAVVLATDVAATARLMGAGS